MAEVNGSNSVPLGRAGTGAAFLLGSAPGPSALQIILAGQAAHARAAHEALARRAKEDAQAAKEYHDNVKYEQDGSVYFGKPLNEKVYKPLPGQLQTIYAQRNLDGMDRAALIRPIKQAADNETAQSKAKSAYLTDAIKSFQGDGSLYNSKYATEHLATALRGADGTGLLPSQFDEEAWKANVLGDEKLYNEKEVVTRTAKGLFPLISQRVADAGKLGGEHTANTVRGRLVAFDGQGHPRFNADGTPVMNLTSDTDTLLDSDPLFKLKTDARVAAYEAERQKSIEANAANSSAPVLPVMTRRGHHAQMLGPLAYYDSTRDEGLNPQVPRPRAAKETSNKVQVHDFAAARQSDYLDPATSLQQTNHYAEVGQTFGSATKPYVEVSAPTANMTIIGQDGKPTDTNHIKGGGNTQVKAQTRVYTLYTKSGKRLGRPEPFATDQEAADYALKIAREYPKPQDLELRVEGRGTLVDNERVAGDGLGGTVPMKYVLATPGKPAHMVPDNTATKTERTVLFPITQEVDDQLSRSTKGEWNRYKHSPAQAQLMREVIKRGGKFVSPYIHAQREATKATTAKPQRPAFLQAPAGKKTTTKTQATTTAADNSGGML